MNLQIQEALRKTISNHNEVEHRNNLFLQNTLNDYGYEKLEQAIESTKNSLEEVTLQNEFEELIERDLEHNLRATEEYANFIRRESDFSVDGMFELLYGEETFDRLKKEAIDYDEKAEYRTRELKSQLVTDNPWNFEEEIQELALDISRKVEKWAKEKELMPEDFDFETQTIPQGATQRANWRGEINQMNLPIEYFGVIRRNGDSTSNRSSYSIEATKPIFAIFHELVGHGVHQYNSESLEYPQFTEKAAYRPSSMAHCEGVSQHREQTAEDFIQDQKDHLPVLDIGIDLREVMSGNRDRRKLYTRFIAEMKSREQIDKEEAESRVGEIYSSEIAERALNQTRKEIGLGEAFHGGSYIAGLKLMEDVNADNQPTEAITTGQWSPKVFSDAVKYFSSKIN